MKKHFGYVLSLRDEPFFRGMSESVLTRVEGLAYHRKYESRQIIYFPDDPCDHVYWVREGRVKITRVSGGGRELTYRHLFPGDIFGEECLVDKPKHESYAEAVGKTTLCLMRADDFRRMAREEVEVSLVVAKRLCSRVDEVEQVLAETLFKSVRSRVASGIVRLMRAAPALPDGGITVTHQELAGLVGSTRETTTAMLHSLREEGILAIANRRVTVLDSLALERIAKG